MTLTAGDIVVEVKDFVLCFFDNDIKPHAEVRGNHVHQAEISHCFGRRNRHL